jgi:hypothetical protein
MRKLHRSVPLFLALLALGCTQGPASSKGNKSPADPPGFGTAGTRGNSGEPMANGAWATGTEADSPTTGGDGPAFNPPATCTPSCDAKVCGDDGCGGVCGACDSSLICSNMGQCVQHVAPECTADADCPAAVPTCAPQGLCILCYPGTYQCDGAVSQVCEQYGGFWETAWDCGATGAACNPMGGKCESGCGGSGLSKTNAGCNFVAVDLRNALVVDFVNGQDLDAQNAQFAVIASNTTASPASVVVTGPDGFEQKHAVPANGLHTFHLPGTHGIDGPGRANSLFRIVSDRPITVYQFNPLSNEGVFSNDASVLLPTSNLGTEYRAVTRRQTSPDFRGYFVIAGVSEGTAQVTVTPTAGTEAGGGIPALAAGQSYSFPVDKGETVSFESGGMDLDLTGSAITSDLPIAVFSGHVAGVTGQHCCADHLEQQLTPVSAWGQQYVIARSVERGNESDYVRVVAAANGTTVTVSPAVVMPPVKTLNAGEHWEFQTDAHVSIHSTAPVMVTQFLASSFEADQCASNSDCEAGYVCQKAAPPFVPLDGCQFSGFFCLFDNECGEGHMCFEGSCAPLGDPAMILAVPVEQWQQEYVFLTPDSYIRDYVNIVTAQGASVTLDGTALAASEFVGIPGTSFVVHRTEVADGAHRIVSDQPTSILVYGYDKDVSYGYPGGMGLLTIGD